MLARIEGQAAEVKATIGEYEFQQFAMNNRFAAEDQRAAEEDKARQNAWYEDAVAEATELKNARDALKGADGQVSQEN
jgi:hypothetical protein